MLFILFYINVVKEIYIHGPVKAKRLLTRNGKNKSESEKYFSYAYTGLLSFNARKCKAFHYYTTHMKKFLFKRKLKNIFINYINSDFLMCLFITYFLPFLKN